MGRSRRSVRHVGRSTFHQVVLFPTLTDLPVSADVSEAQVSTDPGGCPVGCLGTLACLCGQEELSDSPLWIEENLFPFESTQGPQASAIAHKGRG